MTINISRSTEIQHVYHVPKHHRHCFWQSIWHHSFIGHSNVTDLHFRWSMSQIS